MVPACPAMVLAALLSSAPSVPRMGVFILEAPAGIDRQEVVRSAEQAFSASGRFVVADLPDTLPAPAQGENIVSEIQAAASDADLDVVLVLSVREPDTTQTTRYSGDTLVVLRRIGLTVGGRFYSSAGELVGSMDQYQFSEGRMPFPPDASLTAVEASRELAIRSLLQLFPVEFSFTAPGSQGLIELPGGRSVGLQKGMFLYCVATASEIPADTSAYDLLRSRGLLQVIECDSTSARGRLLSGMLAPGGPVTAVEHGAPAFLSGAWEVLPVTLRQGAEAPGFDAGQLMNGVKIGLSNYRWGLCFGGSFSAATADKVSSLIVGLRGGMRLPLSGPSLSLRLTAGPDLGLLMQDVTNPLLTSDASAVVFGGSIEGTLEYMLSERFGLTLDASGTLAADADSWTVQDQFGNSRNAEEGELYYSSLSFDAVRAGAGFFYLIY